MKKRIGPSAVNGTLQAPPSKSFAQRAVAIAAMAEGRSRIFFPGNSDDVKAAINVARQLGADIRVTDDTLVADGGIFPPAGPLDCGEAGLSVRMFSSIAGIFSKPVILTGRGSLLGRPMHVIEESLKAMGVQCITNNGYLPVSVSGPMKGGEVFVDGSFSSQVLTGMLIAAPFAEDDMTIRVKDLKSLPYIDITLAVMKSFGVEVVNNNYCAFYVKSGQKYRGTDYTIEGDWSGAAFLLVAGAIGGQVSVGNIDTDSPQADKAILNALESAGANINAVGKTVTVARGELRPFEFDATHCPDLFPPLVSLAAYCNGRTLIHGANRLRHKESDRASTLAEEFGRLGVKITCEDDVMVVHGGGGCRGGAVSSRGDHRIAMACAVAALGATSGVEIEGADAVAKSYPGFFDDIENITMINTG
jgi:3-phosphoshikimate 1-carboxyvinyltransferase